MTARRVVLAWLVLFVGSLDSQAQNASNPPGATADASSIQNANASGSVANGRVVRDPLTGRTYYQQWVTETVPVMRWENQQINTTIYETQWVNTVVPTQQTVYQPQTQQVPQPYWQGVWNPFRRPTLAYKYVPVTSWVPKVTTVNQIIPRQQVVPKQQTITVPQPITETKTQQRLVQTEIPQATANIAANNLLPRVGYTANQPPALLSIPLLARRPPAAYYPAVQTFAAGSGVTSNPGSATSLGTPILSTATGWSARPQPSQFVAAPTTGLRPVTKMIESILPPANYNAPLRTATAQGATWSVMQGGMQPTELR